MNPRVEMLKQVENTVEFLKGKVEKGEDFIDCTAEEELNRFTNLYNELLYYTQEY